MVILQLQRTYRIKYDKMIMNGEEVKIWNKVIHMNRQKNNVIAGNACSLFNNAVAQII
jgi:hypothetical protein